MTRWRRTIFGGRGQRCRDRVCHAALLLLGLAAWLLHETLPSTPPAYGADPSPVAQHSGSSNVDPPLFAFAQSLLVEGEYYRAIGEFERFLFFHPDHPLALEAQLKVGIAFFCGERWLQAFELFRRVAEATPDTGIRQDAALWMAEASAWGADHPTAIRLYEEVSVRYPETSVAHRATYLKGWSLLRERHWGKARDGFAAIGADSPYHASARRLAAALDPPPALPRRSPTVARALATVLPGGGQLYVGNYLDGAIGLGVHGALIAGTTGAVMAGLEGAAGIGAFFTWGFYRTQMSNAAVSARDFNTQAEERFIDQLAGQEQGFLATGLLAVPCRPSPT